MEIRRRVSDLLASNMYLLVEGKHALVVDPCRDVTPAEGLTVEGILLTHEHYDHISGVNVWKQRTGADVICSTECAKNIRNPKANLAAYFEDFCQLQTWVELKTLPSFDPGYTCAADRTFDDRMAFTWRGHDIELMSLPGHSMGSMVILLDSECLFSGDSLIAGYPISLRFPGGSRKAWREIGEKRLNSLPRGLRVYPGHFHDFVWGDTGLTD